MYCKMVGVFGNGAHLWSEKIKGEWIYTITLGGAVIAKKTERKIDDLLNFTYAYERKEKTDFYMCR